MAVPRLGSAAVRRGLLVVSLIFACGARPALAVAPDAAAAEPGAPPSLWTTSALTSNRSSIAPQTDGAQITLAAGDRASLTRPIDWGGASGAVSCTFNLSWAGARTPALAAHVLRLGSGFGTSNVDESDANTFARLGVNATGAHDGFQLRELGSGRNSRAFDGTQAITWALNPTDHGTTYPAPDGSTEALGGGRMDVWVGRNRVFDEVTVTRQSVAPTTFKWFWRAGSGTASIDHFAVTAAGGRITPGASGAAEAPVAAAPAADVGTVELYHPSPNPFERTTRYAYAITRATERVDIGVFDVSGRKIRTLTRGAQGVGQNQVMWDGSNDSGARVRHGVYFLRATLGAGERVARVVYLME